MRAVSFIKRSVAVVAACLLVASLLGGCAGLDKADETTTWNAQKLYSEAKASLNDGSYEQAIKYYEKLEAKYPYGRYAQQAQLESAYAYYKNADTAQALAAADRFIKLHPNHPNVDYAYYLRGLINFNDGEGFLSSVSRQDVSERDPRAARESFESFKELTTRYPESRYAADAERRMAFLVNSMARNEVHVARYYYRRGAYVAAVARAQAAIQNYPQAPIIEEAMFIMIKGYDALGLNDLRDDTERVMKTNFPKSEYYTRGLDKPEPWWRLWQAY